MASSLLKSLSVLIALTSAVPIYAAPKVKPSQASYIHGLNRINIDAWSKSMMEGRSEGLSVHDAREHFQYVISTSKNESELFKGVKEVLATVRISIMEDYRDLGVMLLQLRQELRQQKFMTMKARQDSLFMMQLLAEESLIAGSKKFKDFPAEINLQGSAEITSNKYAPLRENKVQPGDIVLSKSTGYGSSSLIALIMEHPHIFSHSTPVYIGPNGELWSPEAEIEDGVKMREMVKDYIKGSKTRMYIYRYQGSEPGVQEKVEAGAEKLVSDMKQRTGGDIFSKPAFAYDFSMTPGKAETLGLFCSSVGYEMYIRGGLIGSENPYTKKVWSPVTKGREELLRTLNMNTDRVPAPGDVELNPDFHLVGARVDTTKLQQERIESAILDVFLSELEHNKELLKKVSETLAAVAAKPIDKDGIKKLADSGLIPKEMAAKLAAVDKIPDSINFKQAAFFAFLNSYLTPQLREAVTEQIKIAEESGKVVGPIAIRKMVKQQGKKMMAEVLGLESKVSALVGGSSCKKVWD